MTFNCSVRMELIIVRWSHFSINQRISSLYKTHLFKQIITQKINMGQNSRGIMNVRLTEQLIEMNAVVKPSRREFKSWSWNIYIGIIVLFISLLYSLLLLLRFYSIYLRYHFAGMRFCLFKLFAIYVLNILEYMNILFPSSALGISCMR